jgi:hypothetical protein
VACFLDVLGTEISMTKHFSFSNALAQKDATMLYLRFGYDREALKDDYFETVQKEFAAMPPSAVTDSLTRMKKLLSFYLLYFALLFYLPLLF